MWLVFVCSIFTIFRASCAQSNWVTENFDQLSFSPKFHSSSKRTMDPLSIPRLIRPPPLKRGEGLKRDMSVYPSAGIQLIPRVPMREPPLKRSADYFVERRSAYPLDVIRKPLREPPLKRSLPPYFPSSQDQFADPSFKQFLDTSDRLRYLFPDTQRNRE